MTPLKRPSVAWLCCVVVFVAGVLLTAAEPRKPVVPKVTVLKTDKKAVSGEFVEATLAGVTVKTMPKGESVQVPWAEIKTVSNGLTRQKVVDEWKTAKAELLCDGCHGDGTTKCETCKGSGVDPAQATPCPKCDGKGDVGKCPKCKDGRVPCPTTCLKASMFAGVAAKPDGKKYKNFRNRDGSTQFWSEGHVGELVVQENGIWVNKGKCPTCAGTSEVVCPTCHGTATKDCPACKGAGATGPACAACKGGRIDCKPCGGTGLKAGGPPAAGAAGPTGNP